MFNLRAEHFWKRRARIVCLRHNAAVWLSGWLSVVLVSAVAAACGILILRRHEASLEIVWKGLGGALAVGALAVLWMRRKEYFQISDGFIRLESILKLNCRLTAAAAGVGAWPEPRTGVRDRWQWRWDRMLWQVIAAAALVYAATRVPIPGVVVAPPKPQIPPIAWTEVETWVDALKKEEVVQPDGLENLRAQVDVLRSQDPESWYDHASLEAGDNLQAETTQAIRDLQQNLQTVADQASKLIASSDQGISDRELQAISQTLSGALQNMASGRLPLNEDLLKKLKGMDPKALKPMSQEQMAQLQKQLQQASGTCKKCLGEGEGAQMMTLQEGQFPARKGGPGGGGETAPLTAKPPTDLHTNSTDTMSNDDISRALPGEVVALSTGEHQVDKSIPAPVAGGQVADPGQGGEAVWKDSLTPRERETVARFFQ